MGIINKDISKKVLIVGPDYRHHKGGIGAVIALGKPAYEQFNFIPTYRPYDSNIRKSLFFVIQVFKISFFLLRNRSIKVVHMHTSQDGSFFRKLVILYISKKIFGKKVINHTNASHFHKFYENGNNLLKKIIRYYLRNCDATFAVSESWRKYYSDTFHLNNVYKIFNLSEKKEVKLDNDLPLKKSKVLRFLFLGRLGDRKGIFDLLEAITENKKEIEGKIELLVGGDGEVEKFQKLVEKNALSTIVKYIGWVSGEYKDKLLRETDIFILPSYNEGMPLSILEAMGYGQPIVSTPVAGIPEIVFHNRNGIMVNPGDKKAIFNALKYYIDNPQAIIKHGEQSLEIVKGFYADAVMPQIEGVYKSLLN